MLKLYFFPFSNPSTKVRICLLEKGLEFDDQLVDLATGEHQSDWYTKINADCAVPTLVHDDKVITESNVILEYLEDTFPDPSLMPQDPCLKAQVRQNFRYDESLLHDLFVVSFDWMIKTGRLKVADISQPENPHPNPMKRDFYHDLAIEKGIPVEKFELSKKNIILALLALNARMQKAGSEYVVGDQFSLADLSWVAPIQRLELVGLTPWNTDASLSKVKHWWELMKARPAILAAFRAVS